MTETTTIMAKWLTGDLTIFGYDGQNWMAVAVAAVLLGICYFIFVREPETP